MKLMTMRNKLLYSRSLIILRLNTFRALLLSFNFNKLIQRLTERLAATICNFYGDERIQRSCRNDNLIEATASSRLLHISRYRRTFNNVACQNGKTRTRQKWTMECRLPMAIPARYRKYRKDFSLLSILDTDNFCRIPT